MTGGETALLGASIGATAGVLGALIATAGQARVARQIAKRDVYSTFLGAVHAYTVAMTRGDHSSPARADAMSALHTAAGAVDLISWRETDTAARELLREAERAPGPSKDFQDLYDACVAAMQLELRRWRHIRVALHGIKRAISRS